MRLFGISFLKSVTTDISMLIVQTPSTAMKVSTALMLTNVRMVLINAVQMEAVVM